MELYIELWIDFQMKKSIITKLKITELEKMKRIKLQCPECSGMNLQMVGWDGDFSAITELPHHYSTSKKRVGCQELECEDCYCRFKSEVWMGFHFIKVS